MAFTPNMVNYSMIAPGRRGQTGGSGQTGGGQSQFNVDVPNLQELTKKYQEGQQDYSPEKMTEGMLGRFRSEIRPSMQSAVLGAQTHSARTGQNYADTAGRALGQAVGGMAPALGDVVAQGTELGTQASLTQQQMSQDMAKADATMQMEAQQFMRQIEADFQKLDRQLRAQERIALSTARSNEEIAHIQNQGQMKRTQFIADAEAKASQFAEQQKNWRTQQQLKYLSDAEAGRQGIDRDRLSLDVGKAAQDDFPGSQPGGVPAPPTWGSGSASIGGRDFSFGGGGYEELDPGRYGQTTPFLNWRQQQQSPFPRPGQQSKYGPRIGQGSQNTRLQGLTKRLPQTMANFNY